MLAKQVSVFLENQAGRLAEVTRVLADKNINIGALSMADTTDFGIMRFIVSDPEGAVKVLKENDFTARVTTVLTAAVPNTPGGLATVLETLKAENIGVEYCYAFVEGGDTAKIVLRVEDNEKAQEVLKNIS